MKEFLNKYVYLHIRISEKDLYYTFALVTEITDSHITICDMNRDSNPYTFRIVDVIEIKLSNRMDENGN